MKHLFNCSSELKRAGGVLEIYVLNGVPERLLNMSNLAHFDHFLSICVGDPLDRKSLVLWLKNVITVVAEPYNTKAAIPFPVIWVSLGSSEDTVELYVEPSRLETDRRGAASRYGRCKPRALCICFCAFWPDCSPAAVWPQCCFGEEARP